MELKALEHAGRIRLGYNRIILFEPAATDRQDRAH
jgi:hypothetical protein